MTWSSWDGLSDLYDMIFLGRFIWLIFLHPFKTAYSMIIYDPSIYYSGDTKLCDINLNRFSKHPVQVGLATLRRKDKMQYLLTCTVSRYCLLALHGTTEVNICPRYASRNPETTGNNAGPTSVMLAQHWPIISLLPSAGAMLFWCPSIYSRGISSQ